MEVLLGEAGVEVLEETGLEVLGEEAGVGGVGRCGGRDTHLRDEGQVRSDEVRLY